MSGEALLCFRIEKFFDDRMIQLDKGRDENKNWICSLCQKASRDKLDCKKHIFTHLPSYEDPKLMRLYDDIRDYVSANR